jgi:hypothetical protein
MATLGYSKGWSLLGCNNVCLEEIVAFRRNSTLLSSGLKSKPSNKPQTPLWSRGQSSWLQIHRSRVRFPALSDSLRSSGSGTESTQPREDKWATWMEKSGSGLENRLTAVEICCAYHATSSILPSPTCGGRLVGIVRLRTKSHRVTTCT